jgi:hypothetical protein
MLLLFMSMGRVYVSELRSPTVHPSDGYMCTEPRWNDINNGKQNTSKKMRKQELLVVSLVTVNKPREKTYRVDSMLASFGHIVLRPLPFM